MSDVVETRVCEGPDCDVEFVPYRDTQVTCSTRCRVARWKALNGYSDHRQVARAPEPYRNASGKARRKVSGMQVPLARLERELADALSHDSTARTIAIETVRACLPARQRQRLEARYGS